MSKQFKRQFISWCFPIQISFFGLFGIFLNAGSTFALPTAKLEGWRFDPQVQQLEINLSASTRPSHFYLSQPPRLVVDLPSTKLGYVPTQQNYSGAIKSIRVSQFNEDVTRIVMDLAPGTKVNSNQVQLQPISVNNPNTWLLRPLITTNNNLPPLLPPGAYNPRQIPANLPPGYNPQPPLSSDPPGNYNPMAQPTPPAIGGTSSPFITPPPITNSNSQLPVVTVPPLNPSNLSPQQNLPPANFPGGSGFPIPTMTDYPNNSQVVDFGQPLPIPPQY